MLKTSITTGSLEMLAPKIIEAGNNKDDDSSHGGSNLKSQDKKQTNWNGEKLAWINIYTKHSDIHWFCQFLITFYLRL